MPRSLNEILNEELQDPEFAREYNALDLHSQLAEQVITYRQNRGLTQSDLANIVGTKQSGISRLENMGSLPSLSFLMRVAEALDAKVEIKLVGNN